MKIVNTQEYVSMLRDLTKQGKTVSMRISGNSMSPFLMHGRDSICFQKPDRKLKKGDMVFFQRESGQFVMHRIIRITKDGFYLLGDAQQRKDIEGPIKQAQIFALVTSVNRKGKWIGPEDFWWEFFEHLWRKIIPFRRFCIWIYQKGRSECRKKK